MTQIILSYNVDFYSVKLKTVREKYIPSRTYYINSIIPYTHIRNIN